MSMDRYMNAYIDRRMKLVIDDWQLATTADIRDLSQRFRQVRQEAESLKHLNVNHRTGWTGWKNNRKLKERMK